MHTIISKTALPGVALAALVLLSSAAWAADAGVSAGANTGVSAGGANTSGNLQTGMSTGTQLGTQGGSHNDPGATGGQPTTSTGFAGSPNAATNPQSTGAMRTGMEGTGTQNLNGTTGVQGSAAATAPGASETSAGADMQARPNGVTANGNLNFSTLDRDGNGTISRDEYTYSGSNASFATIDADGNGSISNDELMRFGAGSQSR